MKKLTLIGLEALFLVLIVLSGSIELTLTDLLILGLAASFAGRAVAYMEIFEWFREPFTKTVPHHSMGAYVEPKGKGWRRAIGGLLSCPVCSGTWAAAILVPLYAYIQAGRLLVYVLAIAAIAWFISYLTEAIEWHKAMAWEAAGHYQLEHQTIQPAAKSNGKYDFPEDFLVEVEGLRH